MALSVIILATGNNSRFKSKTPKVLHPLGGHPMLAYTLAITAQLTPHKPLIIVAPETTAAIQAWVGDQADCVQPSTHTIIQNRTHLRGKQILVLRADTPLLQSATVQNLADLQARTQAVIAMTTQKNTPGNYIVDTDFLWNALPHLHPNAPTHTQPWNDLIHLAAADGLTTATMPLTDPAETITVNTRIDLATAEAALQHRLHRYWMLEGVTLLDPASTYISPDTHIGQDTVIHPHTHLRGATTIGEDCTLGPNTLIENCTIGNHCQVLASVLEHATMEDDSDIGPFGHLRKGAHLCKGAHMGNFGEIKNGTLGPGAKMGHFSYLGDADIGSNVNIGAGTITCNYDGKHKHHTVLEDNVFIGSNTLLVAPVHIGEGAQTGAGSVVTHDIHAHTLAYGVPAKPRKKIETL